MTMRLLRSIKQRMRGTAPLQPSDSGANAQMNREPFIIECRRRREAGATFEELIRYLREAGCSKIDSIAVLNTSCGLAKAKELVHLSPTWDDRRAADDAFHATVEEAARMWERDEKS